MSFDPVAGTLLFGGWDGTQALADTWSFDGNRWTNRGTSTAAARYGTALCRLNNGTVMFGGGNAAGTYMQDTRTWNGSDWAPVFIPLGPTPAARMNHDMVYDSANNRIVMFGGRSNSSFNDTWVLVNSLSYIPWLGFWFGPQWMQLGGNAPPARNSHRMAYDAQRGRVVMFGGCSAAGWHLNDTWELVGDTWQQVFPLQSPSPRWNHAMEYDPVRGVVVLIGGYADVSFPDDVWEYDGVTWTQRTPQSTTLGGREGAGCTWDPRIQRMVLRSGYSWGTGLHSDTWFYHGP